MLKAKFIKNKGIISPTNNKLLTNCTLAIVSKYDIKQKKLGNLCWKNLIRVLKDETRI